MGVVACFEGVRCKRWAAEGGVVRIDGQSLGGNQAKSSWREKPRATARGALDASGLRA